jgi:hypothetical protein
VRAVEPRRGHEGGRRGSLLPALALLAGIAALGLAMPVLGQDDAQPGASVLLPPRVDDWLPNDWWTPERVVSGRLNDDAFDDLAVVVRRQVEAPDDPAFPRGSRALFVIYGGADGVWRRGPLVAGLLPCADCTNALGGNIGSAVLELDINQDGLLEVSWIEHRRFVKAVRLLIGWDATYGALGLHADDVRILRRRGGPSHVRRDYRAGRIWVDGVAQEMPARFIPIEDVSAASY